MGEYLQIVTVMWEYLLPSECNCDRGVPTDCICDGGVPTECNCDGGVPSECNCDGGDPTECNCDGGVPKALEVYYSNSTLDLVFIVYYSLFTGLMSRIVNPPLLISPPIVVYILPPS
uniref:Uncharacterized protein n=1 Tax=Cacopsylla melanoneura TaxID=428564 RepID=A0A8D8TME5_9HEMI